MSRVDKAAVRKMAMILKTSSVKEVAAPGDDLEDEEECDESKSVEGLAGSAPQPISRLLVSWSTIFCAILRLQLSQFV